MTPASPGEAPKSWCPQCGYRYMIDMLERVDLACSLHPAATPAAA